VEYFVFTRSLSLNTLALFDLCAFFSFFIVWVVTDNQKNSSSSGEKATVASTTKGK